MTTGAAKTTRRLKPASNRVCPRCRAELALQQMRELYAAPTSPDVNW